MADRYCRSTSTGAANGTTWADAYTTLAAALAGVSAGDTVWVSQAHAETQGSAMTLTCPGTAAAPCKVLCVQDGGGSPVEPPTTLASSATITTTGAFAITWNGCAYVYGITLRAGTGATAAHMIIGTGTGIFSSVFDTCRLELLTTATSARLYLSQATREAYTLLINSVVKLSHATQRIHPKGRMVWVGGSLDTTVAIPTQLLNCEPAGAGEFTIEGVDLSTLNTALVLGGASAPAKFLFRNCKLHASVTAIAATAITSEGAEKVILDNCDSGDTNYKIDHRKYEGSIIQETTIKRTGGANDGTTGFCWKMVSLATPQLFWPLESPPIAIWNEAVGSAKTLTVEIVHDSLTALQDDEIWVEVEYLGTSSFPLSLLGSDRMTNILSTPADQAVSTVDWTTTGITNVNKQKLVATFTPQEKGPFIARVMLAKASYAVYVCPKVTVA